ncbi:MAG: hypothetical protein ACLPWO_08165 [Thermoplasmata archaeon]
MRERDDEPPSFLGIAQGFPQILVHSTSVEQAEADLQNALCQHLQGLADYEATRVELDEFPTVRVARMTLTPSTCSIR